VLPNKSNRTSKIIKPLPLNQSANASTSSGKSLNSSNQISKTINLEAIKKLLNGSNINWEDNSNNVLAILAGIAEAASGSSNNNNSVIANEALQWLDSQGAVSTSGEDTLFQSALESGQTLSLTEAGKLALSSIKEQILSSPNLTSTCTSTSTSTSTLVQSRCLSHALTHFCSS